MKKIMHLLSSNTFSGAENIAIKIIKGTASNFQNIYVSPDGEISKILSENGISHYPVQKFTDISRIIKKYNPDIIHAHDFKASILASFFGGNKRYIISHIHQAPNWSSKVNLKTLLYLISSINFNKIIYVSHDAANKYVFKEKIKDKVDVIFNSININKVKLMAQGASSKKYDLVFVGRMEKIKDPSFFVSIVAALKKNNIKAAMIGDGSLSSSILQTIRNSDLSDNISFKGFKKNPYKYLAESKICVIPSLNEGFSLVAIEAGALSVPVVARNTDGLSEIVKKLNGYLFNSTDQASLVINKLLKDSSLYNEKSQQAFRGVSEYFTDDKFIKKFKTIYKLALDNKEE